MVHDSTFACEDARVNDCPYWSDVEQLHSWGAALIWLAPNSKVPPRDMGQLADDPRHSLDHLSATYSTEFGLGVRLGRASRMVGGYYLYAVDFDVTDPARVAEAHEALAAALPALDLSSAPTVKSRGARRHIYFYSDAEFARIDLGSGPGWTLQVRGSGLYTVLPPSVHPDTRQPYNWETPFDPILVEIGAGAPVVPSEQLADYIGEQDGGEPAAVSERLGLTLDQSRRIVFGLPIDPYRDGERDSGWLSIGFAVRHEYGKNENAFDIWNSFSIGSPRYDAKAIRYQWDRGMREVPRRGRPITMRSLLQATAPEVRYQIESELADALLEARREELPDLPELPRATEPAAKPAAELPPIIAELNERHAVICVGGKTLALTERPGGAVDFGPIEALDHRYANRRLKTKNGSEPASKAWMRHPQRRTYVNGVVFAPAGAPAGTYNLWRGFAVEPHAAGDCSLFLEHLREVICSGDGAAFDWLIGWFAHLVQRPWEKPGTAIVLRGTKGAGKDTVADYAKRLFPTHVAEIKQPEQLTGRFNGHLDRAILAHVEEGFWAGDKSAESTLKALITSERLAIERKGVDIINVDSCLRIFISSNERWVVPATFDERRFFVLNVSGAKAQDARYFGALRREREAGGPAALLHFLQSVDISDFDVRNPPMTAGLLDQKLASLRGFDRWWHDVLSTGEAPSGGFGSVVDWSAGVLNIAKPDIRGHYRDWARTQPYRCDGIGESEFTKHLRQYVPDLEERRPRGNNRTRMYVIPALPECRANFERIIGSTLDWS